MTTICLNMIVKNEEARIERCLRSVEPYIHGWVILDTGSTDNTVETILSFFEERRIPGELQRSEFIDFSTTRNMALSLGQLSDCDYLFLVDADMELVGEIPGNLTAPAYSMLQRGDGLAYWNTRLVHRKLDARYIGVTHEYLSLPTGQPQKLEGPWFRDHCDGANRPGKVARDIALLEADVRDHPENARSWFYLGNSLLEAGRVDEAITAYEHRMELGGWDEEVWRAMLMKARCHRK